MIVLFGGPNGGTPAGKQKEQRTSYAAGNAKGISMGQQKEFQPGALVGSDNSSFVKAYVAMCERGGVSFGEAVERRHELLTKRKGTLEAKEDDEAELAMIGVPEGPPGSPKRRAWFEAWAKEKQERKGGRGDEEEEEGGSAEQVMMMKMLLAMMKNQRGGGGGGP